MSVSQIDFMKTFGQRKGANVGRSKTCMYPVVDGPPYGDKWWCGKASKEDSSYCEKHHKLCRVPPKKSLHNRFVRHTEFVGRITK